MSGKFNGISHEEGVCMAVGRGRLLAMSDIHGEHKAMQLVLAQAGYVPEADRLILLGDYIDRGPAASAVVTELRRLVLAGAVALRGNHEQMMIDAMDADEYELWEINGGRTTRASYTSAAKMRSDAEFFNTLPLYYETDGKIFVHAGLRPGVPVEEQDANSLLWSRPRDFDEYEGKTLVVGHTPTQTIVSKEWQAPLCRGNVIFIDTGMGYNRRLTLLDLTQSVYWQACSQDIPAGPWPQKLKTLP
jgi:serine/threonine protein phosphatase 1